MVVVVVVLLLLLLVKAKDAIRDTYLGELLSAVVVLLLLVELVGATFAANFI